MQKEQYHWQRIFHALSAEIETNALSDDGRLPTIRGACDRFKVSAITVRRAFDELERAGLITRKRFVGATIRKQRVNPALLPATLIVPSYLHDAAPNWYRTEIQRGISDAAKAHGVHIKLTLAAMLNPDIRNANLLLTVDLPLNGIAKSNFYKNNRVVKTYCPHAEPEATCVLPDFQKGFELLTRHLIELGHRRIALILQTIASPWQSGRFDGYARILKRHRIPWDWNMIRECESVSADSVFSVIRQLFGLADPPTAMLCGNDTFAALTLAYCRDSKIRIPEQVSVAGFDNIPESASTAPPLTTVDPRLYKMGFTAMETLARLARGDGKRANILIRPSLITRGSTAMI